jgi:hypothetical protein
MLVIDERNFQEFIPDEEHEHLCACLPRTSVYGSQPFASAVSADFPLIPRVEWKERIQEQDARKSSLKHVMIRAGVPILNQDGLPYCHAFSPTTAGMLQRAVQGLPFVPLSAGSVGGPATGYRKQGAAIEQDLKVISTLGIASTDFVPMMQVSRSGWKAGAAENALLHRCTQWNDMGGTGKMWDEIATRLLAPVPQPVCVGLNWWGHAVTYVRMVILPDGRIGVEFANSWDVTWGDQGFGVLTEAKGTADDAYCPMQFLPSEN